MSRINDSTVSRFYFEKPMMKSKVKLNNHRYSKLDSHNCIHWFFLFVWFFVFFWYETTSCTFCFVFHLDDCSHRTIKMHLMFDQSVIFFVLIIHKTSLNPSLFIEMSVSSRTNGRSCIGVLGVSILPLSTIYLLDFRTVPTVWCVLLFIFHQPRYRPSDKIKT